MNAIAEGEEESNSRDHRQDDGSEINSIQFPVVLDDSMLTEMNHGWGISSYAARAMWDSQQMPALVIPYSLDTHLRRPSLVAVLGMT
jgi:hypothetical protein